MLTRENVVGQDFFINSTCYNNTSLVELHTNQCVGANKDLSSFKFTKVLLKVEILHSFSSKPEQSKAKLFEIIRSRTRYFIFQKRFFLIFVYFKNF